MDKPMLIVLFIAAVGIIITLAYTYNGISVDNTITSTSKVAEKVVTTIGNATVDSLDRATIL